MGIDFGKRHVRAIVRDVAGSNEAMDEVCEIDVPHESERSLAAAVDLARKVLAEAQFEPDDLVGLFVGVPAPIDFHGRIDPSNGMPDWRGKPADKLKRELQWATEFRAVNDADLGAIAELEWGAARGYANAIYLKWSSGIGGGLIVNGRLIRGADGYAGEIGHALVPDLADLASPVQCENCGLFGCIESVAGGDAIIKQFADLNTLEDVVRAAREGVESDCAKALDAAAEHVGQTLGPIISTLNPEILVVGGAFSREEGDYSLITNGLVRGLKKTAFPPSLQSFEIDIGEQTGKAAALGGVALALREHLRQFLFARL
jgi:predicted NBD/HSP70 family sugar kinase